MLQERQAQQLGAPSTSETEQQDLEQGLRWDPVSGCSTSSAREGPETPDWMKPTIPPQPQQPVPDHNCRGFMGSSSTRSQCLQDVRTASPKKEELWTPWKCLRLVPQSCGPMGSPFLPMSVLSYLAAAGEATEIYRSFIHTYTTNNCVGSYN